MEKAAHTKQLAAPTRGLVFADVSPMHRRRLIIMQSCTGDHALCDNLICGSLGASFAAAIAA